MLIEKNVFLSDGQALTASAASENVLNLGESAMGNLGQLWLNIRVGTALASSGTAATLDISLESDSTASVTTDIMDIPQIAEAACTAGAWLFRGPIPMTGVDQYLRLYYTVGTENFTSGTIYAWLSDHPENEV